jgi:hypothetical protein
MANQTVTTTLNYDSASIGGLLDGESISINGGSLTIDADTAYNQQAAAFGPITLSSTLGGSLLIDGTKVWEIPFTSSTGNVPTQNALGSNGVTGGTSGATGELTRVWASGSFDPATAGGAMPAAGFIKLRSKTGNFQAGETITLPGGATIVAASAGKRSVIQVIARTVGNTSVYLLVPRLASFSVTGDWYELGETDGTDNQTLTLPVREELGGIQIETAAGSGVYEWFANAGDIWNGHYTINEGLNATNGTLTRNTVSAFPYPAAERLRETTANGVHNVSFPLGAFNTSFPSGTYTFSAILKRETRQWVVVQFATNGSADRYGVLVDLDAGTLSAIPNVGTPTGTSSSITALGNGWYRVNVTINHTGAGQTGQCIIATSNSATPTYVTGLPSFAGSASEGVYIALSRLEMASFSFIPTDVRGKHCGVDPIAGTVQLALRGTNNSGFKPPSGCKIRIPNVFLSTTQPVDAAAPMLTSTNLRYYINAAGGAVPAVDKAVLNWFNTGMMKASNTCTTQYFSSYLIDNSCVGCGLIPQTANALWINSVFIAEINDSRFCRRHTSPFLLTSSSNVSIKRSRFDQIAAWPGISQRTPSAAAPTSMSLASANILLEDCEVINGVITFNATKVNIKNLKYADVMTGTTPASNSFAMSGQGSDIDIDGVSPLGGLAHVHPYQAIFGVLGFYRNLSIANIGTPASPWDVGSANAMGHILNCNVGSPTMLRRIYLNNLRSNPINWTITPNGVQLFDCWATGDAWTDVAAPNFIGRGNRFSVFKRGFSGAQGTHWNDAYDSPTTGRIQLFANEPTALSASQFTATFGVGSGYTGTGGIIISKITDDLVWTAPYKFYGHTAFGGGCSVAGTDTQNLIFEYKIDTGGGFGGSWTLLANTVRCSNPTSGQN